MNSVSGGCTKTSLRNSVLDTENPIEPSKNSAFRPCNKFRVTDYWPPGNKFWNLKNMGQKSQLIAELIASAADGMDHLKTKDTFEPFADLVDCYLYGIVTDILRLFP